MTSLSGKKTALPLIILKCIYIIIDAVARIFNSAISNSKKLQNLPAARNVIYFFKEQSYMIFLTVFTDFFTDVAQKAGIVRHRLRRFRSVSGRGVLRGISPEQGLRSSASRYRFPAPARQHSCRRFSQPIEFDVTAFGGTGDAKK
jgi:hypothetical protein